MSEEKKKRDFSNFKLKVQRTPTNERSYQRYAGRMRNSVQQYTDEELIKKIIDEGDPATLREVSRYYARVSGIYKNTLLLLSNLLFYDTVVSPVFDPNKKLNKEPKLMKLSTNQFSRNTIHHPLLYIILYIRLIFYV